MTVYKHASVYNEAAWKAAQDEIKELRENLVEQWEEAHFDHCGRLDRQTGVCLKGADCMWHRPRVLDEAP